MNLLTRLSAPGGRELGLAAIVVLALAGVGALAPAFVTPQNLANVLHDTAILIVLALAQMLVILTRGIDLSVAANLAFSGMAVALLAKNGIDIGPVASLGLACLIGLFLGSLNGILIAGLSLPPIVVTLGTMSAFRGMIYVIAGGGSVSQNEMFVSFLQFPLARFLGLTALVWIAVGAVIAAHFMLTQTRFGRDIYTVGSNPTAAHYVGVSVRRVQFSAYALCGAVAGACGYLWVARYAIAFTEVAVGFELTVIAACVVGGVSISGAVGSVPGVVLGALLLGIIGNALPILRVSPFWQMAISGAVIIIAVTLNALSTRDERKQIMPLHQRHGPGPGVSDGRVAP